jgi:hypothetical protein
MRDRGSTKCVTESKIFWTKIGGALWQEDQIRMGGGEMVDRKFRESQKTREGRKVWREKNKIFRHINENGSRTEEISKRISKGRNRREGNRKEKTERKEKERKEKKENENTVNRRGRNRFIRTKRTWGKIRRRRNRKGRHRLRNEG